MLEREHAQRRKGDGVLVVHRSRRESKAPKIVELKRMGVLMLLCIAVLEAERFSPSGGSSSAVTSVMQRGEARVKERQRFSHGVLQHPDDGYG